ncbi:hypothetical protein [Frankia sp. AvcI1]|uniref:hypothetical protein n=1 Tax=Frankia sp. AvcI1 TaxID=573496 RepID=UPI0006EBE72A|nr:hypothetical protein [Frankia sp. AvcI1]
MSLPEDAARNRQIAIEAAGRVYEGYVATGQRRDLDAVNRPAVIAEEIIRLAHQLEEYLNRAW